MPILSASSMSRPSRSIPCDYNFALPYEGINPVESYDL